MFLVRPHTTRPSAGFTLIEMAIVMIISGFVLVAGVQAYHMYLKSAEIRITNEALARVDKAINDYFATHGRFPCPSDPGKSMASEWRGKEWGRDRESGKYDGDGDGIPETSYPNLPPADVSDVWKDGKDGPVSAAYCKTDPDDTNKDAEGKGDYYRACIATGIESVCNIAIDPASADEVNRWPSPRFNDNNGSQKCGISGGGSETNQKPTGSACTSSGARPDDTVDNNNDGTIDSNSSEFDPEAIACIKNVVESVPAGSCTVDEFNADEKVAGGLGTSNGDYAALDGSPVRDLLVLKGGVPYLDLGLSQSEALDGYNHPLVYAVTAGLTRKSGWDPTKTGIVVATYDVTDAPQAEMPQQSAQYVLVSLGKNGSDVEWYETMGSGTIAPIDKGQPDKIVPCRFFSGGGGAGGNATGGYYTNNTATGDGYIENENCDADSNYVTSLGKNTNRDPYPSRAYYDDTLLSNISSSYNNLWISKGANIYNTNAGNVGVDIGASDEAESKLDVNGDTRVRKDLIVSGRMCSGPGGDSSPIDGSFDCEGGGVDIGKLQAGKTCPPGQVLSRVHDSDTYTCTTITGVASNFKCPPASNAATVFTGYVSPSEYKCVYTGTGTNQGRCKVCPPGATVWNNTNCPTSC